MFCLVQEGLWRSSGYSCPHCLILSAIGARFAGPRGQLQLAEAANGCIYVIAAFIKHTSNCLQIDDDRKRLRLVARSQGCLTLRTNGES